MRACSACVLNKLLLFTMHSTDLWERYFAILAVLNSPKIYICGWSPWLNKGRRSKFALRHTLCLNREKKESKTCGNY